MTSLSFIDDLEEAKTEEDHDIVATGDSRNPTRIGTDIVFPDDTINDQRKNIVENDPTMNNDDDDKNDDNNDRPPEVTATTSTRKQIKTTVAADAPWIDRIWEGM
jgi:hypothetical protein